MFLASPQRTGGETGSGPHLACSLDKQGDVGPDLLYRLLL